MHIFNTNLIYLTGDKEMNKKLSSGLAILLPNKRINLFVIFVIVLGIISGSIFLISLNATDKKLVVEQIKTFMENVNINNINNFNALKNVFTENMIFTLLIWVFGMSVIGIIFNIFLIYLKGFILGFTISSFILVYSYKGLLASFVYVFPSSIINIITTILLGVYSIILTIYLWKMIFLKDKTINVRHFLKKYVLILVICLVLVGISSLAEGYLIPAILKLGIKLFI